MPVYLNGKKIAPTKVYQPSHDGEYEIYKGPYAVNPLTEEAAILLTAEKVLTKDITVNKIYFSEVSNTSGGNTVYIGL